MTAQSGSILGFHAGEAWARPPTETIRLPPSIPQVLKEKAGMVLEVRDAMQNRGKKVKFHHRQCEYLLQRNMGASKEILDLLGGTGTWN